MLSFSLTNLPLSMYVVDDLPRRYFASRQIPLPLIFTGNGACRPRPHRKSEMNFCSTVICSLFRLSFCAGAGFGRGAAPPETGNELLFHCYLFPVPPAGPSFVPQSICRGNSRKGRHGYPGGSRSSLCLDINQKKFLVVTSIILDIHY